MWIKKLFKYKGASHDFGKPWSLMKYHFVLIALSNRCSEGTLCVCVTRMTSSWRDNTATISPHFAENLEAISPGPDVDGLCDPQAKSTEGWWKLHMCSFSKCLCFSKWREDRTIYILFLHEACSHICSELISPPHLGLKGFHNNIGQCTLIN